VISFEGFNLKEDGKICRSSKVNTINEATARASRLRECLVARKVHSDILEFCKEELLADNYFHSVFESTKSVAEKIRKMTGLNSDGACLVDEAFSFKQNLSLISLVHRRLDNSTQARRIYNNEP